MVATAPSWPLGTAPTSKTRELTMAKADTKAGKQPKSGKKRMSSSDMLRVRIDSQTIWQMIGAVVLTLAALWAMNQARSLLWMLILSFFFSLALQPGVNGLVSRYGWRRGAAVGVIYLGGIIAAIVMILFLIPAITPLATAIGESGSLPEPPGFQTISESSFPPRGPATWSRPAPARSSAIRQRELSEISSVLPPAVSHSSSTWRRSPCSRSPSPQTPRVSSGPRCPT